MDARDMPPPLQTPGRSLSGLDIRSVRINIFAMDDRQSTPRSKLLATEDVADTLGVSRATVYAYVSRGLIGASPDPSDPRRSLYDAHDVDRLAAKRRVGRSRKAIAASTVDWGEPVLRSGITDVRGGRLRYRGADAVVLSETATLEQVASLLWQCGPLPGVSGPHAAPTAPMAGDAVRRCVGRLAGLVGLGPITYHREQDLTAATAVLRETAAAAADYVGQLRSPIHEQLSLAWTGGTDAADAIRRCLVLCADHELNVSTYAARVVASTGAPLGACALAGLAALTGPLHGGIGERIRAMLGDTSFLSDPERGVADRLARGQDVPGFGHPLYPDGDPRADAILRVVPVPPGWSEVADAVMKLTGKHPHIDFALAAVVGACGLPADAAFAMFATGRVVGWIAHSFEQRADGKLIRPRAAYAGP